MNRNEVVQQMRRFNRFYTPLIGIFEKNYLHSGYSVTENRILYELYVNQTVNAKQLCDLLSLDKGYVSHIIAGFEKKNMVRKTTSATDKRSFTISLTDHGMEEAERVIEITNSRMLELVRKISDEDCVYLCEAMRHIEEKLSGIEVEQDD